MPGKNKGLVLLLNAHSDWQSAGSVESDFTGFVVFIGSNNSFPLMSQQGIDIKPGFTNIISINSLKLDADEDMKILNKTERNCLFPEETQDLKIHKEYSYLNCKFECFFFYTQSEVYKKHNSTCQPWYFPTADDFITVCDPWESYDFFQIMSNDIPDDLCPQCLPDCRVTNYYPTINSIPFETCDYRNLGVSPFCKYYQKIPKPMNAKLTGQIEKEIINARSRIYVYTTHGYVPLQPSFFDMTNVQRRYPDVLKSYSRNYSWLIPNSDAFEKDIAMVNIIYQKSTAVLMGSQNRMTWIDYFSAVGGLLGLVLGMGFFSVFELIWLCLRIASKKFSFTKWIS